MIFPEIQAILDAFPLSRLDVSTNTIYALRPDLQLAYVNDGWRQFATLNGANQEFASRWSPGSSLHDAIPESLRPFFQEHFTNCLATGCPWQHRYDCSSPEMFREFIMRVYPLGQQHGFLVVHSQIHQSAQHRTKHVAMEERYCDDNRLIIQCVHCRRIQRPDICFTWELVPEWVEHFPSNTSHGLCEPCYGFYYKIARLKAGRCPKVFCTREYSHRNG